MRKSTREQHGERHTRLYETWASMKARCLNPNKKEYVNYGARGITICQEWIDSYITFSKWARLNGYHWAYFIDRIDNDKGYYPENCRWVVREVNMNNNRHNRYITAFGETKTMTEWSDDVRCACTYIALKKRIYKGIEPEQAIVKPNRNY